MFDETLAAASKATSKQAQRNATRGLGWNHKPSTLPSRLESRLYP
jgi:hypothetical protein